MMIKKGFCNYVRNKTNTKEILGPLLDAESDQATYDMAKFEAFNAFFYFCFQK